MPVTNYRWSACPFPRYRTKQKVDAGEQIKRRSRVWHGSKTMTENETERFLKIFIFVLLRLWHNAPLSSYLYTTWILWSSLYVSIEYCLCFHINRLTNLSLWIWLKWTPKRYIYFCDLSGLPLASLLELLIWLQEVVALGQLGYNRNSATMRRSTVSDRHDASMQRAMLIISQLTCAGLEPLLRK